jgi:hypothetical protein
VASTCADLEQRGKERRVRQVVLIGHERSSGWAREDGGRVRATVGRRQERVAVTRVGGGGDRSGQAKENWI